MGFLLHFGNIWIVPIRILVIFYLFEQKKYKSQNISFKHILHVYAYTLYMYMRQSVTYCLLMMCWCHCAVWTHTAISSQTFLWDFYIWSMSEKHIFKGICKKKKRLTVLSYFDQLWVYKKKFPLKTWWVVTYSKWNQTKKYYIIIYSHDATDLPDLKENFSHF